MTNQKYEIYEIDGVKYQTTCDPYPCGTMDKPACQVNAYMVDDDDDAPQICINFPVTDPDADDLADMCDWDAPYIDVNTHHGRMHARYVAAKL